MTASSDFSTGRGGENLRRQRSVQSDMRKRLTGVGHLDILAEDEVREPVPDGLHRVGGQIDENAVPKLRHTHIARHATLRREQRTVAALAGRKRLNVVGQQTLKVGAPIASGESQPAPGPSIEQTRSAEDGPILIE